MIEEYIEGFKRCYPAYDVRVKPVRDKRFPQPRFRVFLNGNAGDTSLTAEQMREATRDFNRGR